jgi:transcriptional regulator with XRE-family HTH domain
MPIKRAKPNRKKPAAEQVAIVFGEVLRRLREERDMSQEKLAEMSDLHRTYVYQIERGKKQPSVATMIDLARALNISLADFASFLDERLDR